MRSSLKREGLPGRSVSPPRRPLSASTWRSSEERRGEAWPAAMRWGRQTCCPRIAGVRRIVGHMNAEASSPPAAELNDLPVPRDGRDPLARANFLPYPVAASGPAIIPNDLTSFRSSGVSRVEKQLQQQLLELREQYIAAIDRFNWNKLVYESEFRFEPVMGETYYLYRGRDGHQLSMIGPGEWSRPFVGAFRLNVDRCWELVELGEGIDPGAIFGRVG